MGQGAGAGGLAKRFGLYLRDNEFLAEHIPFGVLSKQEGWLG